MRRRCAEIFSLAAPTECLPWRARSCSCCQRVPEQTCSWPLGNRIDQAAGRQCRGIADVSRSKILYLLALGAPIRPGYHQVGEASLHAPGKTWPVRICDCYLFNLILAMAQCHPQPTSMDHRMPLPPCLYPHARQCVFGTSLRYFAEVLQTYCRLRIRIRSDAE